MQLVAVNKKWYILPKIFVPEIPDEQMRSYSYTLFKKQGKRVISSFPTAKDDKVKKPFAAFKQANFIRMGKVNYMVGEILNADDIPINVSLKVSIHYEKSDTTKDYYPGTAFQYNLSPKAGTFFQVQLDSTKMMDSLKIKSINIYVETDVSEKGYIHGSTTGYAVKALENDDMLITTSMYNELTTEINIPGILIAEKDVQGNIWQSQLALYTGAIRSGLNLTFDQHFQKIENTAQMLKQYPINLFINGQPRNAMSLQKDDVANSHGGIALLPHSFISQEIYLQ